MHVQTVQPEKKKKIRIYVNEKQEFYFEGEILQQFDLHGVFLGYVRIERFIIHYRENKEIYFCVKFQSLEYKSRKWTLSVDVLGEYYIKS